MPKIVDHDQQRELLLDACFRVFAEQGYAAATMRKLAQAAGVSTGTLYHYFPDKQAILAGLLDLLLARDTARVRNQLPDDAPVPARIHALFDFFRDNADYLRDLLAIAVEVRRHEPSAESRQAVREGLLQYQAAMAEILGIDGLPVAMAFELLLGMLTRGTLDPDAIDVDAQEAFVQGVWRQIEQGVLDG